jgi:branched-chain amino acid transport system ATP-binding protein
MLEEKSRIRAEGLNGGQQQMLAIAQALTPRPRVIMLDEPSVGLAPVVVEQVLGVVRRLKAEGVAVLSVEQLVEAAMAVADEIVILGRGRTLANGPI